MFTIYPTHVRLSQAEDISALCDDLRQSYSTQKKGQISTNVVEIAKNLGVNVHTIDGESPAVLCIKDQDGNVEVSVMLSSHIRQSLDKRFTLAFALGQLFLQAMPKLANGKWKTSGLRITESPLLQFKKIKSIRTSSEKKAIQFASELIMPEALCEQARSMQEMRELAGRLGVDMECLELRAHFDDTTSPRPHGAKQAEKIRVNTDKTVIPAAKTGKTKQNPKSVFQMEGIENLKGMDRLRAIAQKLDSQSK